MKFHCSNCKHIITIDKLAGKFGVTITCENCRKTTMTPDSIFGERVIIGDFVIEKKLASGGMGTVYLAHQITLDRKSAIKILMDKYSSNSDYVTNFIREARAAAKLNHQNIVQAYAVGEDDGNYYFAMEYLEGTSVQTIIDNEKRMAIDRAIKVIIQIAEALDFAWTKQQMVHRDIKPDNIMITPDGIAKLADLGLAQLTTDMSQSRTDDDTIMGTPYYICPETLIGDPVDNRSDLYSLGATFYHVITGQLPFTGNSPIDIAAKHLNEPLRLPHLVLPEIPENVSLIINKMMAKNPDDRYQNAQELVIALTKVLNVISPPTTNDSVLQAIWECINCSKINRGTDRYCASCGHTGFEECPICNQETIVGVKFCPHCGGDVEEKKRLLLQANKKIFDDLEAVVRNCDLEKAIAIMRQLKTSDEKGKKMVLPDHYDDVIGELKKQLEMKLQSARNEKDLDKAEQAANNLVIVFGHDAYGNIKDELAAIKKQIGEAIFQANIAMSANYLSKSLSILEETPAWRCRSAEGGDRREIAISKCQSLIQDRNKTIRLTEVMIRNGNFAGALHTCTQLAEFKRTEKITNVTPASQDIEINNRIGNIFKMLSEKIEGLMPVWLKENRWDEINATMKLAKKVEILTANQLEQNRKLIKSELTDRYNHAVALEHKKRYVAADKAWQKFLTIHPDYLPIQQKQYALEFANRKQVFYSNRRLKLAKLSGIILLISWLYPLISMLSFINQRWSKLQLAGSMKFLILLGLQFLVFGIFLLSMKKRLGKPVPENEEDMFPPWYVRNMSLILIFSPFSYLLTHTFGFAFRKVFSGTPLVLISMLLVLLSWLIIDAIMANRKFYRPAAFSLSISWLATSMIGMIVSSTTLTGAALFSMFSFIQALIFAIIQFADFHISRLKNFKTGSS